MSDDPFSQWRRDRMRSEEMAREILGVTSATPLGDIKKAYRALARKWHPDRNRDDPEAHDRFTNIVNAYLTLAKGKEFTLSEGFLMEIKEKPMSPGEYMEWWKAKWG